MDLISILEKSVSPDITELKAAQSYLEQASQTNLSEFLKSLSNVLQYTNNSPVARMAAGLQLKNALSSKDPEIKLKYQERWLQFPSDVRIFVKQNVLSALGTETLRPSSAALCVAYIAVVELPRGEWPDLILLLTQNITNINSTEMTKEATLEAIECICQDIEPNVFVSPSNGILASIVLRIRKHEPSDHVELTTTTALLNSANFEKESERHVCMQAVCEATQSVDEKEPNVLVSLSNDILTFHGIRKDEPNDHVELAATTALLNLANFEKESERHVCMQAVCKNALSAGKKICYNVEMQKLLKFLKTVKRDFYYQQVLLDLYHQMKIFMNSNGYASKGLPDLEHLIKLRSICDVIHSSKIEQWKKLFNYIKSNDLSEFVKPLKELIEEYEEFKKFPSYTAKVGYILDKIFLIGQNCRDYTLEEKREIAALIVPCLQPLKVYIESIYRTPRTRLDCYIRQRRSALQFIAEEYSRFPLDGKILANDLEKVSLKESIEILDNLIEEYRDLSSEDSDTDLEEAGSTLMPRSHSWWTK